MALSAALAIAFASGFGGVDIDSINNSFDCWTNPERHRLAMKRQNIWMSGAVRNETARAKKRRLTPKEARAKYGYERMPNGDLKWIR